MSLEKGVRIFKALSDPTRLRIVLLLVRRELCVCELMFVLKMEQSRLSHQLRILRDAGLVEDLRKGRWMIYRISLKARRRLGTVLEAMLKEDVRRSVTVVRDLGRLDLCLQGKIRSMRAMNSRGSGEEKGGRLLKRRRP